MTLRKPVRVGIAITVAAGATGDGRSAPFHRASNLVAERDGRKRQRCADDAQHEGIFGGTRTFVIRQSAAQHVRKFLRLNVERPPTSMALNLA